MLCNCLFIYKLMQINRKLIIYIHLHLDMYTSQAFHGINYIFKKLNVKCHLREAFAH